MHLLVGVVAFFITTIYAFPISEDTKPLAMVVSRSIDSLGNCYATYGPVSEILEIDIPAWYNKTWESIVFHATCKSGHENVAVAPQNTEAESMAKYFLFTYTSGMSILDYTDFETDTERLNVLEYYWRTGRQYYSEPEPPTEV